MVHFMSITDQGDRWNVASKQVHMNIIGVDIRIIV